MLFSRFLLDIGSNSWSQLGADIDGEAANDASGNSVSLNAAGDRVAIGAYLNDGNGADSGQVRIYSWDGSVWSQLGADIEGEATGDYSGWSISLNAAGDRVAIGAPKNDDTGADSGQVRVYSWNGVAWTQIGADINGEAAGDWSGCSVSLNAAGDRVAIGAYLNDGTGGAAGHVRIYYWNSTAWTQLGADIDSEYSGDSTGWSLSLNAAGDRVAIGAYINGGGGANAGQVRVYSWNSVAWTQLGIDIDGVANTYSGFSVSINAAGDRVAIGAYVGSGSTKIYSWNSTAWVQLGTTIYGEAAGDRSGYSVSLNATGDRVAIGAYLNDGNGANSGHTRIYSWDGSVWVQLGADIDGEATNDSSGLSVSLNAAGDRVAIGAPGNSGGGANSGQVRVFSI